MTQKQQRVASSSSPARRGASTGGDSERPPTRSAQDAHAINSGLANMRAGRRRPPFIAISWRVGALCAFAMLVGCGGSARKAVLTPMRSSPRSEIQPPVRIPQSFVSIANYSPSQIVYPGDLERFNTKWWLGGFKLSDAPNQTSMLSQGYHFLPSFNTGYVMRTNGLTGIPASVTKQADPHSCIDTVCALNASAILSEVQNVQHMLGSSGNYYDVGNEVDSYSSDDVSPSVYVGQFDTWVNAIKQGDPSAKIVGPSIDSVSCCHTIVTQPFGSAGTWFQTFVTDYEQRHSGVKPPLDVLSMHLYNYDSSTANASAAQADNYLSEVQKFRQEADSLGYAGTPIWITELGFLYPPGGPLTAAQSSQITSVLSQLAAGASTINLQRLFLFTDNQPATINDGLRPLYDPSAASSPSRPMPLSDYGQIAERLAARRRLRTRSPSHS